uniref:Uncharacterized protein n=1 Tax=Alexandrium monilatum TaxID=311494 RepID=A0A7S4PU64_9DINO|mmetsp:Transcript_75666/g.239223  ORF Transcript_75666/g.239223 Transcript_75666/m.239223 type:complete len:324 (+) Transcript_75666:73-1044(+)
MEALQAAKALPTIVEEDINLTIAPEGVTATARAAKQQEDRHTYLMAAVEEAARTPELREFMAEAFAQSASGTCHPACPTCGCCVSARRSRPPLPNGEVTGDAARPEGKRLMQVQFKVPASSFGYVDVHPQPTPHCRGMRAPPPRSARRRENRVVDDQHSPRRTESCLADDRCGPRLKTELRPQLAAASHVHPGVSQLEHPTSLPNTMPLSEDAFNEAFTKAATYVHECFRQARLEQERQQREQERQQRKAARRAARSRQRADVFDDVAPRPSESGRQPRRRRSVAPSDGPQSMLSPPAGSSSQPAPKRTGWRDALGRLLGCSH